MNQLINFIKKNIIHIAFVILSCGLIIFLYMAPEETTSFLPYDENHSRFYDIKSKKEAEKYCLECHDVGKEAALSPDHPPKYRCLFCHKRQKE